MTGDAHVVLVGLMGSGKTSVGIRVAQRLGREYVDSDDQLAASTGLTAAEYATTHGRDTLHEAEAVALLDALGESRSAVIAAAASTIEDERCRAALADAFVVWLDAEFDVLARRAATGAHRPLGDDIEHELREQAQRRAPLFAAVADLVVDAGVHVAGTIADDVVRAVTLRTGHD